MCVPSRNRIRYLLQCRKYSNPSKSLIFLSCRHLRACPLHIAHGRPEGVGWGGGRVALAPWKLRAVVFAVKTQIFFMWLLPRTHIRSSLQSSRKAVSYYKIFQAERPDFASFLPTLDLKMPIAIFTEFCCICHISGKSATNTCLRVAGFLELWLSDDSG